MTCQEFLKFCGASGTPGFMRKFRVGAKNLSGFTWKIRCARREIT
ncbi:MAG: hypothetical protein Q4C96_02850 [Planctomycetia bacterium]|nr:hypothetical protein [Planctomycetia bacterium]